MPILDHLCHTYRFLWILGGVPLYGLALLFLDKAVYYVETIHCLVDVLLLIFIAVAWSRQDHINR